MRRLYAAAVLLFIAIGLCVIEYESVCKCTDTYLQRIENIEKMVSDGKIKKAAFAARETEKNWEDTVTLIDMLLFHDYVDEIGRNLAELESLIVFEEEAELYATCENTKEQLISLKESELPVPKNII